jgi:hypothetical protein
MINEEPKNDNEVTPEGAVEVNEEDLDQASGGSLNFTKPTDSFSLNYNKIDTNLAGQKVAPTTDLTGAGPGGGPHVAPQQKF